MPTFDTEDTVRAQFCSMLDTTLFQVNCDVSILLLGDFKARVGKMQLFGWAAFAEIALVWWIPVVCALWSFVQSIISPSLSQYFKWETASKPRSEHWHLIDLSHSLTGWRLAWSWENCCRSECIVLDRSSSHSLRHGVGKAPQNDTQSRSYTPSVYSNTKLFTVVRGGDSSIQKWMTSLRRVRGGTPWCKLGVEAHRDNRERRWRGYY